jgi:glyoxylate reductase
MTDTPTVAVIAPGNMGAAVAKRLTDHKVTVLTALNGRGEASIKRAHDAGMQGVDERRLAEADFVSVHVPLLSETRGLFNAATFTRIKPTAFLINTSRGPVVDETALVAALETGRIAGAGLDVYENEPLIHPGLKRANVVLAPHLASASLETRTKMARMAAENVTALLKGRRPPNTLNPEVLKAS